MSIIKRKKQNQFFIMSNDAAQNDLENLSSIGLLAYIISLPADFKLYKTYLQNKFTRRTVDGAFKELTQKKYIAGYSAYINRKKQYFYIASDEKLTEKDFNIFVHETFYETLETTGHTPKNLRVINDNQFNILIDFTNVQNVQHTNVQNVQYKEYSTTSAVQNAQVQINNNKEISQRNITNINNNYKAVPPFYNWLEN
jgi:hypothetical protein